MPLVAQSLDFTCGAACFDSMVRYFHGSSPGEMHFAERLGTLELGYTQPDRIVHLARQLGLIAEMSEGATHADLIEALKQASVIFVTWWDEDAGHYSLVKYVSAAQIHLMDPWTARDGRDNQMPFEAFNMLWRLRGARMISVRQDSPRSLT